MKQIYMVIDINNQVNIDSLYEFILKLINKLYACKAYFITSPDYNKIFNMNDDSITFFKSIKKRKHIIITLADEKIVNDYNTRRNLYNIESTSILEEYCEDLSIEMNNHSYHAISSITSKMLFALNNHNLTIRAQHMIRDITNMIHNMSRDEFTLICNSVNDLSFSKSFRLIYKDIQSSNPLYIDIDNDMNVIRMVINDIFDDNNKQYRYMDIISSHISEYYDGSNLINAYLDIGNTDNCIRLPHESFFNTKDLFQKMKKGEYIRGYTRYMWLNPNQVSLLGGINELNKEFGKEIIFIKNGGAKIAICKGDRSEYSKLKNVIKPLLLTGRNDIIDSQIFSEEILQHTIIDSNEWHINCENEFNVDELNKSNKISRLYYYAQIKAMYDVSETENLIICKHICREFNSNR